MVSLTMRRVLVHCVLWCFLWSFARAGFKRDALQAFGTASSSDEAASSSAAAPGPAGGARQLALEAQAAEAEQAARGMSWSAALQPAKVTDKGGLSAGVAVAARAHIGMAGLTTATESGDALRHRYTIRHCSVVQPGGINVASVYLHDCLPPGHPKNLALLHELAGHLRASGRPYIIGGLTSSTASRCDRMETRAMANASTSSWCRPMLSSRIFIPGFEPSTKSRKSSCHESQAPSSWSEKTRGTMLFCGR